MTELRRQLRSLRHEYRAAQYPGELSVDVSADLGAAARGFAPWRRAWVALVGGAVAAAVALGVFSYRDAAMDGVATLGDSVQSIRVMAEGSGLWPDNDEATARNGAVGADRFRIVPEPLRLELPGPPAFLRGGSRQPQDLAVPATQEAA